MIGETGPSKSLRPGSEHVPKVVILTTIMLTFISLWRAAAVVLSDLASTAYYIGGIAQHAIGEAAPWFIVGVMLFSVCVRAVYVESCSMFVRGGVYRIVKEAMGLTMAKVAVSALVFDFVLTGPISSVSAGHYVYGLLGFIAEQTGVPFSLNANYFSTAFALIVTAYFWWLNIKGIEESSDKALKIMWVTAGMVVILLIWSAITIVAKRCGLPGFHVKLGEHSLGWLSGFAWARTAVPVVMVIAFGHSLLAMSGEETLAQVYREIEAPKHRNLIRAAVVIFIFSFVFTGLCNLAAFMIIPEAKRLGMGENLLNGLVMEFVGPVSLRLLMTAFVVGVGGLILSGAVNTAIIGSNGVLNRVAEDGVLDDWFRHPHRRFGTTYRIINTVVILQLVTILVSRGNITLLGEAYAFGVVWSFAFMCLSMLILRFKYHGERSFRVPVNPVIRGREIPLGLGLICAVLLVVAVTNLLTKEVATVSGATFTAALFCVFSYSQWHTARKRRRAQMQHEHKEKFILERKTDLTPEVLDLPEGRRRVLVPIRDPNNLSHLKLTLKESHGQGTELIVMTIKVEKGEAAFQHIFTSDEERLFTRVVQLAEEYGETIVPIVVPSNNSWFAIARTAHELHVDEIVLGKSGKVPPDVQMEQLALMWGMVSTGAEKEIKFRIVAPGEEHSATL
jgi:amino acid transporter